MSEVIIKADSIEFEDKLSRTAIDKLITKVEDLNKRTKIHTIRIHEMEKRIKELENEK